MVGLASITFSLRPEEALYVTSQKLACFQVLYYVLPIWEQVIHHTVTQGDW